MWSKNGETNSVDSNLIDGQTNLLSWSKIIFSNDLDFSGLYD